MIKNERQYRITKSQLDRFQALAEDLRTAPAAGQSDLRHKLEVAAAEAQVDELRSQVLDYEGLRDGRIPVGEARSLEELPDLLIRARIARSLTQKALADKMGLKEQQIQRYEASRWSGASLARLIEVARLLNVAVDRNLEELRVSSLKEILKAAQRTGLASDFIERRLLPHGAEGTPFLLDLAARMNRIFGWIPSRLLAGEPGDLELPAQLAASYKLPMHFGESRVRAYTVYTHYLAMLALDASVRLSQEHLPQSAAECRSALLDQAGTVDFQSALKFTWNLGIPVLPLTDPGGFHAIVWRSERRNVIVLKQQNRSASRWLFDLLHELHHAAEQPGESDRVVIDDTSNTEDVDREAAANQFAGDVMLNGQAEGLVQHCVDLARGRVDLLKQVVPEVAVTNGVDPAALANYLAYRLSLQGINWWGAAANLQLDELDPWSMARDEFLARADLGMLPPLDRELLSQALSD